MIVGSPWSLTMETGHHRSSSASCRRSLGGGVGLPGVLITLIEYFDVAVIAHVVVEATTALSQ